MNDSDEDGTNNDEEDRKTIKIGEDQERSFVQLVERKRKPIESKNRNEINKKPISITNQLKIQKKFEKADKNIAQKKTTNNNKTTFNQRKINILSPSPNKNDALRSNSINSKRTQDNKVLSLDEKIKVNQKEAK